MIRQGDHFACCTVSDRLIRLDLNSTRSEIVAETFDWQRVAAVMSLDEARRLAAALVNCIADAERLAAIKARRR